MPQMHRYAQGPRTAARVIDGAAFVVAVDRQMLLQLNEVGTFVWEKLSRPSSVEGLARSVAEEFDVTADDARRDVEGFLTTLIERGVVTVQTVAV